MSESVLQAYERNHYFYGKLLTVRDFQTEQTYFNEKRNLINRLIHGSGIVCGLQVVRSGGRGIQITPGVAMDCSGREIIVSKELLRPDIRELGGYPDGGGNQTLYLILAYDEHTIETVPALGNASACDDNCEANRIQEGYQLHWMTTAPEAESNFHTLLHESMILYDKGKIKVERIVPRWIRPGDAFEVTIRVTANQNVTASDTIEVILNDILGEHLLLLKSEVLSIVLNNVNKGAYFERQYFVKANVEQAGGSETSIRGDLHILIAGDHIEVEAEASSITISPDDAVNQRVLDYFNQTTEVTWECSQKGIVLAAVTIDDNDEITAINYGDRKYIFNNPLLSKLLASQENELGKLPPHSYSHSSEGHDPLNVANLQGLLAEPQWVVVYMNGDSYAQARRFSFEGPGVTVYQDVENNEHVHVQVVGVPHAETHVYDGSDPIDVTNLKGVLIDPQKVAVSFAGKPLGGVSQLDFGGSGISVKENGGKAQITVTDTIGVNVFEHDGSAYVHANKLRFIGEGVRVVREGDLVDVMITSGSPEPQPLEVLTGTMIFPRVYPGESHMSPVINEWVMSGAIMLALEYIEGDSAAVGVVGDRSIILPNDPSIAAVYQPAGVGFSIFLRDQRPIDLVPIGVDWRVRWWVIPAVKDTGEITSYYGQVWYKELIITRLILFPGTDIRTLSEGFNVEYSDVEAVINQLLQEKRIIPFENGFRINSDDNTK